MSPRSRRPAGVPTEVALLRRGDRASAGRGGQRADLIAANNVLAHVPDLNDFVAGFRSLLKPTGRAHVRVPASAAPDRGVPVRHDLPRAFLLFLAAGRWTRLLARHGLRVFDVERAADAWRLAADLCRARAEAARDAQPIASPTVLAAKRAAGLDRPAAYERFGRDASSR